LIKQVERWSERKESRDALNDFTDTFRPLSGQIIVDRGLRENPLRHDLICPQLSQEERVPRRR
jgi:pyrimidine operon attenuation protein/uracil phosphoribosyltransferase